MGFKAEKAFEALNQSNPPEFAIKDALTFLETATFIEDLSSAEKRDAAFLRHIVGDYAKMLTVEQVRNRLEQTTLEAYK